VTPAQRAKLERLTENAAAASTSRARAAKPAARSAPSPDRPVRTRPNVSPKGSTESPAPATPKAPARRRKAARPLTGREMVDRVVQLVEKREQPRSTVTIDVGPRGQVMPKVTIVTGEDAKRVDAAVLKACSVVDYLLHRYAVELAGGLPTGNGE
jgi:hypothetical protein